MNEPLRVRAIIPRRKPTRGSFRFIGLRFGLVLGVALTLGSGARAAPVVFSGLDTVPGGESNFALLVHPNSDAARLQFLSNLTGGGTEDFETYPDGTPLPITLTPPGAPSAVLSGSGTIVTVPPPFADGDGRYPISGTNFLRTIAAPNTTATYFTITFASPIAALGFYGTDFGDFQGQASLELHGPGGLVTPVNIPHSTNMADANGSVVYMGVIDTMNPFTRVDFIINTPGQTDVFGFDGFTWATAAQVLPTTPLPVIPAPPGFILAGIGGVSLLGYGWRRRSAAGN